MSLNNEATQWTDCRSFREYMQMDDRSIQYSMTIHTDTHTHVIAEEGENIALTTLNPCCSLSVKVVSHHASNGCINLTTKNLRIPHDFDRSEPQGLAVFYCDKAVLTQFSLSQDFFQPL